MDKIKKFLIVPVIYHVVLLAVLAVLYFSGSAAVATVLTVELLLGGIATPAFFALLSVIHAVFHDAKVYDYIYKCLAYLAVIGLLRLVVYAVLGGGNVGVMASLACIAVSVGVFTLWDCLFAIVDKLMKKRPGKHKKK